MKKKFLDAYMDTAKRFAELSTAHRAKVGAIIVKDNRIISIGYNGMPTGWTNECEDFIPNEGVAFEVWPADRHIYGTMKTKAEVLHAESNAIAKMARSAESCEGATMFCTHLPCMECAKLIYQSGISYVYYDVEYDAAKGAGKDFLKQCGVAVIKL